MNAEGYCATANESELGQMLIHLSFTDQCSMKGLDCCNALWQEHSVEGNSHSLISA